MIIEGWATNKQMSRHYYKDGKSLCCGKQDFICSAFSCIGSTTDDVTEESKDITYVFAPYICMNCNYLFSNKNKQILLILQ